MHRNVANLPSRLKRAKTCLLPEVLQNSDPEHPRLCQELASHLTILGPQLSRLSRRLRSGPQLIPAGLCLTVCAYPAGKLQRQK